MGIFSFDSCYMNLFPPYFMYFNSASKLISGRDVGVGTMLPLTVIESDIRINDYISMLQIE